MTRRVGGSSRHALESCTQQLQAWKPFQPQSQTVSGSLETARRVFAKKPCRSDRSTAPSLCDSLDFSSLSLVEDASLQHSRFREGTGWFSRKRRRRRAGSRSISGRSSDRVGASVTYATCSDFPIVGGGTDSSGELFGHGDGNWGSDVSDVKISRRNSRDVGIGGAMDRDIPQAVHFQGGSGFADSQWNDSGYGSETGYKGDAEFGYGEEIDEEEEDGRLNFWGDRSVGRGVNGRKLGETGFSDEKISLRCRRKKQDPALTDSVR